MSFEIATPSAEQKARNDNPTVIARSEATKQSILLSLPRLNALAFRRGNLLFWGRDYDTFVK